MQLFLTGVSERFDDYDDDVEDGIKQKLTSGYGFHSKRRALSYNRHIRAFKNVTLDNIPNELRVAVDNEAFLRHENTTPGEEMLIFFADNDLECLAAAETIICDGNFVFTPPEVCNPGQLYTVHAIVRGESHPIAYALIKRRDTAAYEELFTALKVGVLAAVGHLGTLQNSATWLFDFEVAAIKAAVNTFSADALQQPITVYGCVFHFAKAINQKRDALGLRSVCRSNPDVSLWFTRVRHLPFLPEAFRLEFARDLTTSLPQGLSPLVTAELSAFGTYFQNFWIDSSSVQNLWGHFGNTGPRTTNHVEGWHNGLRAQLPNHHPQLAEVTQFFRMQQHCSQVSMSSLLHDQLAVQRQQDPAVSRKNVKLDAEMEQFRAHATYNLVSFDLVCQYLDKISGIGVLPSA
ncbi:hypothetical protein HPB47_010089 [Ixodes persulcatus]|uniref:Uncharacterized protein n=1 Tax=Ixodes persulcatus TaxID=34615 RepID=A0AC60P016_IXOPE|nr:hypothetical protein HPB47_010089 [Ixodes persulcatus]